MIKQADLIPSEDDFESLSLQNFSQSERTCSPCGIVFMENDEWWVYDAMAGAEILG